MIIGSIINLAFYALLFYFVLKLFRRKGRGNKAGRQDAKQALKDSRAYEYRGEKGDSLVTLLTHRFLNYRDRRESLSPSPSNVALKQQYDEEDGKPENTSDVAKSNNTRPAPRKNIRLSPWGGTVDSSEEYYD